MMQRIAATVILVFFALVGIVRPSQAQEARGSLDLSLSRTFGASLGSGIQGTFTLIVNGPAELEWVEFMIDGQVIGVDTESPFRLRFNTGDYDLGVHRLTAVGYLTNGETIGSNAITREFVAASNTWLFVGAILLLVVGFRVISHFLTRQRSGGSGSQAQGSYGLFGGAVCRNCGRPFGRPWWAVNLGVGRYARCPHCGKWQLTTPASPQELREAEAFARELDESRTGGAAETPFDEVEDQEQRRLDESRYL